MPIEFLAYSAIVLRSQRPGPLRPVVQFIQAETNDQPVVIPAKAGIQLFNASWTPAFAGVTPVAILYASIRVLKTKTSL
jgi:hypothetical protein